MADLSHPIFFVGVDWATEKHDLCLLDATGKILLERAFVNTGAGLAEMCDVLMAKANGVADAVWVGIEVPHGPVVETLMERGFRVHAINPKQLDRFRDRFTVAGAKDDRRDALVLADSLRTDARAFRRLVQDSPEVMELREWSRMADDLQQERNRLTNRVREQLRRFYPQALQLGDDPGADWFLTVLEEVPTPAAAGAVAEATIAAVLKRHRISRLTAADVLKILREKPLIVAPGTAEAASSHIRLVAARIRLLNAQHAECCRNLDKICRRLAPEPSAPQSNPGRAGGQRDVEVLRSLPGVGRIVLATLLAEAAQPVRDRDYPALRSLSGVAPITRRSGKRCCVSMRHACQLRLRRAVYHWARVAAQRDSLWKERYRALRARGHSHGRACRGIADRLLAVATAMLREGTTYDPNRITRVAPRQESPAPVAKAG
jgi:transposase